jgi:NAD(P)-dependent dehydrogenase (short-subunit alcohol dehydrogenase family)
MSHNPLLRDWTGKTVWLIGASSGIGLATAQALHARGARVAVSARKAEALASFVQAHPGAVALPLDATDPQALREAAGQLMASGGLDLVAYCAGHYKAQRAFDFDLAEMLKHQDINYLGALYVLDAVLPHFLQQRRGHISLISSVAGFRGLPNSLAYGPTKAALINLAETLYADLSPRGLGVSLINPGFVKTGLTAQNQFAMPALITAEQAADEIVQGWARGRFEIHFPRRFTFAMKLLQWLPYGLYLPLVKRMVKEHP